MAEIQGQSPSVTTTTQAAVLLPEPTAASQSAVHLEPNNNNNNNNINNNNYGKLKSSGPSFIPRTMNDPAPGVCFLCWNPGHGFRFCPDRHLYPGVEFCFGCGRRHTTSLKCARCRDKRSRKRVTTARAGSSTNLPNNTTAATGSSSFKRARSPAVELQEAPPAQMPRLQEAPAAASTRDAEAEVSSQPADEPLVQTSLYVPPLAPPGPSTSNLPDCTVTSAAGTNDDQLPTVGVAQLEETCAGLQPLPSARPIASFDELQNDLLRTREETRQMVRRRMEEDERRRMEEDAAMARGPPMDRLFSSRRPSRYSRFESPLSDCRSRDSYARSFRSWSPTTFSRRPSYIGRDYDDESWSPSVSSRGRSFTRGYDDRMSESEFNSRRRSSGARYNGDSVSEAKVILELLKEASFTRDFELRGLLHKYLTQLIEKRIEWSDYN